MKSHHRDLLEKAVAFSFSLDTIKAWRRRDVAPTSLKRLWRKKFYRVEKEGRYGAQILRTGGRGGDRIVLSFTSIPGPVSFGSRIWGITSSGWFHSLKFLGERPQFFFMYLNWRVMGTWICRIKTCLATKYSRIACGTWIADSLAFDGFLNPFRPCKTILLVRNWAKEGGCDIRVELEYSPSCSPHPIPSLAFFFRTHPNSQMQFQETKEGERSHPHSPASSGGPQHANPRKRKGRIFALPLAFQYNLKKVESQPACDLTLMELG